MSIKYMKESGIFHLQGHDVSYAMQVVDESELVHLYYGKKLKKIESRHHFVPYPRATFSPETPAVGLTTLDDTPRELPDYGRSDYRTPAFVVQNSDGSTITDLKYVDHKIYEGKNKLKGLPATYVEYGESSAADLASESGEELATEATSLEIIMKDELCGLEVVACYTVYETMNVITRNVRYINKGNADLRLDRALSTAVDFESRDFELLHLHGAWARERHMERVPVLNGIQRIDSKRGSSSHQHNPFMALLEKGATETAGEVYGFSLVYSGSFMTEVEKDQFNNTRIVMGINDFDFTWLLQSGETFQTPECVMVYSDEGIGGMSRTYHKLYRSRLCRGKYRDASRPVLVNNWEATYFDFNADKIKEIASVGSELGIELFVLDDGWFKKRINDKSSLGDWVVDEVKLPEGLDKLADDVNAMHMAFGLWFEPEMVSPDSDLYRAHPDWCLHVNGRHRTEGRNQLVLDLSREDVCDYIVESVSRILSSVNISYVKWDMNRNMTEIGSALLPPERQRETAHRYMLGLYNVLERITSQFPDILFESCSGGGGRFDPGMLYYMPQTWTSDDTDAVERLKIQYGTSIVYPISTMGAHVSAVPNHQVQRMTSLKMRGDVAMSGNFGYELDLTKLTEEEKSEIKEQVAQYKELRELIQFGDMYRLLNPFESNDCAWMVVSEDKSEAFVAYFKVLATPHDYKYRLKLQGLEPSFTYEATGVVEEHYGSNDFGGDELMYAGFQVPYLEGDYTSHIWHLKKKVQ